MLELILGNKKVVEKKRSSVLMTEFLFSVI